MNPRLATFFSETLPGWNTYSDDLKQHLVDKYNSPEALESFLYEITPDLYQVEQSNPGYVRQVAGELTGGAGIIEQGLAVPKQVTSSAVEGVGGLFEWAGMPAIAEYGEAARVESTPAYGSSLQRDVAGLGQSITQNLAALGGATLAAPVLGANPATAIPLIALASQAAIKGGQNVHEYLKRRPGEQVNAGLYGLAGAATEVVGEVIPFKEMQMLLKSPTLAGVVNYIKREGLGEIVTETGDIGAETLANIGQTPDRIVGDIETPMAERLLKAGGAGILAAGPTAAVAARVINPRIMAAQQKYDAMVEQRENQALDQLVQEGNAEEVIPGEILPTQEELDTTLIRGLEANENLQREEINTWMDIIDEYQAAGDFDSANEATDELFAKYDPLFIETELSKRQAPTTELAAEPTAEPTAEPAVEPTAPAAPTVVKPTEDQRNEAFRAATIFQSMQEGDTDAAAAWEQLPNNVKAAVPYILSAEKAGIAPGKKAARALLGKEGVEGADEVSFQSSVKPGQAASVRFTTPEAERARMKRIAQTRQQKNAERLLRTEPEVGDTVTLRGKFTQRPKKGSATLDLNFVPGAKVIGKNEDGTYQVEVPGLETENQQMAVSLDQIVPRAEENITGQDTFLGPTSPTTYSLTQVAKKVMTDLRGWVKIASNNPEAFGSVTIRGNRGQAVKMRLDYAMNQVPNLFEKTVAHELGHIVSMVSRSTAIPGMDMYLKDKGNLLGQLVGEWTPMEKAMLIEPFEMLGDKAAGIYEQQRKFDEKIHEQYPGDKLPAEAMMAIQNHWNRLVQENAPAMMNKADEEAIRKRTAELIRASKDRSRRAEFTAQARQEILGQKNLVPGYIIRKEMETVVMKMRGVPNTPKHRKAMIEQMGPKEIYADFFAAKFLDLYVEDENIGKMVRMADHYAPTASLMFDAYMERKPATKELFNQLRSTRTDAESVVQQIQQAQANADAKAAARMREENPENLEVLESVKNQWVKRGLQMLVDTNLPLYKQVREDSGREVEEDLREKMEQLAGVSSIVQPFMEKSGRMFEEAFETIRRLRPDKAGEAESLFGVYMMYKRIAEGGRQAKTSQQLTDAETGEKVDVNRAFDLYSGSYGGVEQAQKVLKEYPVFGDPVIGPALDKTLQNFHKLWDTEVLQRLRSSGLISAEQYNALASNVYYATFAIEREMLDQVSFKAVTPTIKAQTGTLQDPRNPLGATMEKAISLIWNSKINEAKRQVIRALDPKFVKEVTKQGSMFPMPIDKANWSLITFKENGKDKGYHVPKLFAAGVDFQEKNWLQHQFFRSLGESSAYFRNLYTTWNMRFVGKNALRDLARLVIRSFNPRTGSGISGGLSVSWQYAKVLFDLVRSKTNPEAADRLNKEEEELYRNALTLSDYDWQARDAYSESAYTNLMRQHLLRFRAEDPVTADKKGRLAQLFGWYTNGMEGLSRGVERVSKRAAYRHYSQYKDIMSEAEFNQSIRKAGSPYFLNHGELHPITSNVFLFFNPMVQGMYEDLSLMKKRPAIAGKWALATTMKAGFHIGLMQAMATIGAFGDDLRKIMMLIPEDDLDGGVNVPLGVDAKGRAVYLSFPVDETTALFTRLTRRILHGQFSRALRGITEKAEPQPHPLWGTLFDAVQIASGVNPKGYRERPLIPEQQFRAGGLDRWKPYLKHLYNTISPTAAVYRFPSLEMDDSGQPTSQAAKMVGQLIDLPMAQTFATFGILKVSNRGAHENADRMTEDVKQTQAWVSLRMKEAANAAVEKDGAKLKQLMQAVTDVAKQGPEYAEIVNNAIDNLDDRMKTKLLNRHAGIFMVKFLEASTAERIAMLRNGWPIILEEDEK